MMRRTLRVLSTPTRHNGQTPAAGIHNFFELTARGSGPSPPTVLHGFEFQSSRSFPELNICAYEFRHLATNAVYLHIDAPADTNNAFCMGFRTPAINSKGTTHVLEHTVLCGSQTFPVRDPFFLMTRRSLASFMNAMTGMDYTLYPFSTTNEQDFANLLKVYTDAVLCPLLRAEDFAQEAHRVEVKKKEPTTAEETSTTTESSDTAGKPTLGFNGVVFNEMRGVVSQPSSHYMHQVLRELLPQTHYTHVSGGYPLDILDLTHREVVEYHKTHYHPSNSITMTYGDMFPHAHMKHLDAVFSNFGKSTVVEVPTLPEGARQQAPKVVTAVGPSEAMGDVSQQKRVSVSYAAPSSMNSLEDVVRLAVLDALLTNGPSSPMHEALIQSRMGSRFSPLTGYAYYLSSPILSYGVEGASNELSHQAVEATVTKVLQEAREKGFDQRRVQSVIFQQLLQNKHRTANYGVDLTTGLIVLSMTKTGISPLDFVDWTPHLKQLEAAPRQQLDPVIDSVFLTNPHRTTVAVEASATYLRDGLQASIQQREDALNASTTAEDCQKIEQDSAAWLARVRAPVDSSCLPTLTIRDIPSSPFQEPCPIGTPQRSTIHTIPFATNGLVYVHGIIPFSEELRQSMKTAPTEVDVHLPLYVSLLGRTGAGTLNFKELSVVSELASSGFGFGLLVANRTDGPTLHTAGIKVGFYTTKEKLPEALRLLRMVLAEPRSAQEDPTVRESVVSLASERCLGKLQSIQRNGHTMAAITAGQGSLRGQLRERWAGLTHCEAAATLHEQLVGPEAVQEAALRVLLDAYDRFVHSVTAQVGNATLWATCEPQDQVEVTQQLVEFQNTFAPAAAAAATSSSSSLLVVDLPRPVISADSAAVSVLKQLPIDTGFAARVISNSLSVTDREQQALRVAAQITSSEFLHRCIREEGGAYGSSAASNVQGDVGGVTLSSYRDPTPDASVTVFDRIEEFLNSPSEVTQQRVDEGKLRLFAAIDSPVVPQSLGEGYFSYGTTHSLKQEVRSLLLSITVEDVRNAAKYFKGGSGGSRTVVLKPQ